MYYRRNTNGKDAILKFLPISWKMKLSSSALTLPFICQRICDVQTKILKKYDLTPRQSLVLAYLRNHPEDKITQKTLEDKMHLSNPTVTVIVQSMIGKGLICQGKRTQKTDLPEVVFYTYLFCLGETYKSATGI